MEKYKYGPLVYNTTTDEDDSGNFYWNGMPPVGYDSMKIPIDPNGNSACLLSVLFTLTIPLKILNTMSG